MSVRVLPAEQALANIGRQPYIIAPLPYTSTIDLVADPAQLETGNWQAAVADRDIAPSVPTLVACRAAAAIACAASTETSSFAVAGEHTYGSSHTSTTTLMERAITAELRSMAPRKRATFSKEKPLDANTTTSQITWLAGQPSQNTEPPRTMLVAFGQHIPRVRLLAELYGLNADIVDAHDILRTTGTTDDVIDQAIRLFEIENANYEQRAFRATSLIAKLGKRMTSLAFRFLSKRNGPNVVDIETSDTGELSFIQMSAPRMVRHKASAHSAPIGT